MVSGFGGGPPRQNALGIDRLTIRLAALGVLIVVAFVALFSRLWYLQVLASEEFAQLAKENRVRRVESEPPRGDILDRNGMVIVQNRMSRAVAIDREVLDRPKQKRRVLNRLSGLLGIPLKELRGRLHDQTVSPYKPVAVATDVSEVDTMVIKENEEDFPGVITELLPVRRYPHGRAAAHVVGYVREISEEELKSDHFKGATPPYKPGDIVGKMGVEYTYDRWLRGRPAAHKVIVNSTGKVIGSQRVQEQDPGHDLYLSLDLRIQKIAEQALRDGLAAARGAYQAPAGAVAILDPRNGEVIALASEPTYNPSMLADGITPQEWDSLGYKTAELADDDALLNRALQAQRAPGSTYKVVTAGAAMSTGIADAYRRINCPGSAVYPPEGGPGSVIFPNWTSIDFGAIDFPTSLEISCDTFYYQLGWEMESAFGPIWGDGTERFQKYARLAGIGHETGIDIPNEADGRVPDEAWCLEYKKATDGRGCPNGWYPGYTVNMAIGQGDLVVTPIQMAVTYGAIANGGTVWEPRAGLRLTKPESSGDEATRELDARVVNELPLDDAEVGVIQDGLERVVAGANGTAAGAFAGFPLDVYPVAGKTGTAELSDSNEALNDAWFVSYGPMTDPSYVIAVYVEKAGHGGETAAPIARQIWEGIFNLDDQTDVHLGQDDDSG